jgi:hypothetical protein
VIVHCVTFERNLKTGEWRARCSCGWHDVQPDKERIDNSAARHPERERKNDQPGLNDRTDHELRVEEPARRPRWLWRR